MRKDLSAIEKRLILRGTMMARTGLRVGADRLIDDAASDLPVMRDARGLPYIPGSSFKGSLRSAVEAMLRGATDPGRWVKETPPQTPWSCDPSAKDNDDDQRDADAPCLNKEWIKKLKEKEGQDNDLDFDLAWDHSCSICRVFGNNELGGRVLFADMPLVYDPEDIIPIEVRVAIERDTLTAKDGAKYDYEVVPAGTQFELEIVLDNPDELSTGLLVAGLEAFNEGHARIGGFASRGLGRVDIKVDVVKERTALDMLTGKKGEQRDWAEFKEEALKKMGEMLSGGGHA